ncbi:ATP-binding cassette domain-containing protein [Yoonia sp. 208BN28-4]|uniref:ATP-binding cassette domain-containing protein n=1 Tax=Yoonia sp. 208BN28-4 TaxID=3126505 RepID=UPI0030A1A053
MSGPVLAFDMNATRGGKLTRIETVKVPAEVANDPAVDPIAVAEAIAAPETETEAETQIETVAAPVQAEPTPEPTSPFSEKAVARAELASTYASFLGVDLQRTDLMERLTADSGDDFTAEAIAAALNRVGLVANVTTVSPPQPNVWPALAEMTSGQMVLVLDQQGDMLTVYDSTRDNNQADVEMAEFLGVYAGKIIRADVQVNELNRRHANEGAKKHWFWGEISKFRKIMFEVALGSFVANLLAVAVALFSLQVYDRVIPHQSIATLWVLAIGAGLAMLLEAFLRIARARLMDSAGRKIELRIQNMLMDRLLGMQAGRPGQTPSGTFAAVREFSAIREFFTASTIGTLTDLPFIVLFLALVASIGGNVVWVLFAGGILMVLPSFFMQKKMMALTMATQGASVKSSRLLHESIYDLDTIKSQRGEERFRRIWGELSALSSIATSEQRKLSTTLTFWSQGVQQATYVAAVVVGTFMVFQGMFTVGTIIAVGILTSRTLGPLTQLAGTLARWANVKAALEALDEIADAPQDVEEGRSYLRRENLQGGFELREVIYTYDEEAGDTLNIPALTIQPGQKIAVLGANGSGKSTLLKMMSGLHRPTSGRVLIDGVDMGQVMSRDLRRGIGYLSQEVRLFAGTLRENLNLTLLERDDERMLAALDFAGMGPFVRNHPRGLDLEIRDGGEGLSIGQRQSIGWARLWLQNPKVCLLDEPTAALDQTLESTLVSRLETWLEGRTAIIATHRVPILALADRTMILDNGRLIVDGPRDEVLAHLQSKKAS